MWGRRLITLAYYSSQCRAIHTLLQQNTACEAVVHVPEVDARYAALKVPVRVSIHPTPMQWPSLQLPIYVKSLVRLDLHLPYAVARCDALLNGRLELVAPWTPPAVAIAVVVAAEEVALGLGALLHRERDVDRLEQVFFERRVERYDVVNVALYIFGVEAAEEVAGAVSGAARAVQELRSLQGAVYGVRHVELWVVRGVRAEGGTVWVVRVVVGRQSMPLDVLWGRGPVARVMRVEPEVAHGRCLEPQLLTSRDRKHFEFQSMPQ
jgi:hypothetical protein